MIGPAAMTITRCQTGFVLNQTQVVELNDPGSEVALWDARLEPGPSASETWARSYDFEGFREKAEQGPIPCVIVRTARDEYWLSPRFGLVRKVASKSSLELVFSSAVR